MSLMSLAVPLPPPLCLSASEPAGGTGASKQTVESLKNLPPQQQLMMAALGKLLGEPAQACLARH